MRLAIKILLWAIAVFSLLFITLAVLISFFARPLIIKQIEKSLNTTVSLKAVNLSPPFSINLIDLGIGDLFKADKVSVSFPVNVTIVRPVVNLVQNEDGTLNLPKPRQQGKPASVFMTGLSIRAGKVVFTDKKISTGGFKVVIDKIDARVSKVSLPVTSMKTNFRVSAAIASWQDQALGDVSFSGWIDFGPKDMDAVLKLKDLSVTYFSPYYGDFISRRKLLSAKLNTVSIFKAENNELAIDTHFSLSDLIYAQEESREGELPTLDITKSALDLFTDREGKLVLDFRLKSKFDNPEFTVKQLKKAILNAAAKNLANQPPEDVVQKISDTIGKFKDFGEQMQKIFKGKE